MNQHDTLAAARLVLKTHPGVYVSLGKDSRQWQVLLWHPDSGTWFCVSRPQVEPSAEKIRQRLLAS